ncbi:MAG: transglycosylase domain-containing protein [Bacteroidota bacterium]
MLLLSAGFYFSVRSGFFGELPDERGLKKIQQNNASVIFSSDGKMLGLYYHTNRTNARIEEVPQTFIDALIATEDVRFYEHQGFDSRSFFRVLIKSILLGDEDAGGGSTISQQLAKNLYPRTETGLFHLLIAKTKEIIIATRLEEIYSKEMILELYLNTVPFGENTYGIETAARTYFGKKPAELEIQESTMMVGLLKANTGYNPRINPKAARDRRNTVIGQMVKYGYITEQYGDSLADSPLVLNYTKLTHNQGTAPYFREMIRHETKDILREYNIRHDTNINLYTGGLSIYTTLNARLQQYAREAVDNRLKKLQEVLYAQWNGNFPWYRDHTIADLQIRQSSPYKKLTGRGLSHETALDSMAVPRKTKLFTWQGERDTLLSPMDSILYHFGILQNGLLAVEARSGKVLAWIGGTDFGYFKYDHVHAKRQTGSAIKPLIYAAALEEGLRPCEYFKNDSLAYPEADNWVPRNADRKYGGYYSVQGALVNSINTISVKILMHTGIDRTMRMLHNIGISPPLPDVPSLALGSAEIPLYELVPAYAAFINDGRNPDIQYIDSITDIAGHTIYKASADNDNPEVFSEKTCEMINAMLLGVTSRGTAAKLQWEYGAGNNVGGKTGTTQNYADGWFVGVTPKVVIGTWVGSENPAVQFRNMRQGEGSYTAMPIVAEVIKKAKADPEISHLFDGTFSISSDIRAELSCEDFKEKRSLWDFLSGKKRFEKLDSTSVDSADKKIEHKRSKIGNFLHRICGGDENKRNND